jgi:mannose-6-phosphate isomerase
MSTVSVIVPSYNSSATIARTLNALLRQTPELLEEIIVVDSSDDVKTKDLLKKYAGMIRVIHCGTKVMPAIARNRGAEQARAEMLAFIDSDAYPAHDWLVRISTAGRRVGRVGGGSVLLPEFQKNDPLALAQYYLQFNEYLPVDRVRRKKFVPSCNLYCEKALFVRAGGFPRIRASEDVLFGAAVSAFAPVMFDPEIRVHHIFRSHVPDFWSNQRLLGRYIWTYRRDAAGGWIYSPWAVIPLLPVLLTAKALRIAARILRHPEHRRPFLKALFLWTAGLIQWGIGFAQASLEPRTPARPAAAGTGERPDRKCVRPWGNYEVLHTETGALTKRIEVLPGMRLSLQKHAMRDEKWVIVSGRGTVTLGSRQWEVEPGALIEVPAGVLHRIHNTAGGPLIFIEVQLGAHLTEEDIVRVEDDFGRVPAPAAREYSPMMR